MANYWVQASGIIALNNQRIALEPLQQEIHNSKYCYNDDPLFNDAALGPFAHVVNIADKLSVEKQKSHRDYLLMALYKNCYL